MRGKINIHQQEDGYTVVCSAVKKNQKEWTGVTRTSKIPELEKKSHLQIPNIYKDTTSTNSKHM